MPRRALISSPDAATRDGTSKSTGAKRHFLGWDRPLVRAVVEHVSSGWDGAGALDLGGWLIIVPTRNASRRLREALAAHAAEKNAAVLPPRVVTPDFLTSPEHTPELNPAGPLETLLIWTAELLRIDLDAHRALFPVDPVERSFSWALKTAEDLLELRETLNEKGLGCADVARVFKDTEMEPERWRDLASVEQRVVEATVRHGFADWQATRRHSARQGKPPAGVARVMLAGVLDPSSLAIEALESWSRHLPVEVLVYAPEATHQDCFDLWGRPLAEAWLTRQIDLPNAKETTHQGGTPEEQAAAAVGLITLYDAPGDVAAIGVADTAVLAPLEKALAARGTGAFDPAGRKMGTHGVFHLLRIVSELTGARSFRAVTELVRCPDVTQAIRACVEQQTGEKPPLSRLLDDFDTLAATSLPDTLDDAIDLAPQVFEKHPSAVPAALAWIDHALQSLNGRDFGLALTDFLGEVFAARRFRSDNPQDAVFSTIADQILQVLDALDELSALFPDGLAATRRLELLLQTLAGEAFHPERRAHDIDLQGWLELLWEDAPHLVITGMNDGKAPEAILGHAFLPDSARRILGLRSNDTRFARDACLMTALIESRRHNGGRVDFIFGRTAADGAPLRPSRLLFQSAEAALPERTLHFFQQHAPRVDPAPWRLAWRLQPRPLPDDAPVFHRLRVTQFSSYLLCPFRFYLGHGLGMEEIDTTATEMSAMEFGSLLHGALEDFAQDETARRLVDAAKIREVFHAFLDRRLHGIYGARLSVPVIIQRESARQRLGWWAEHEAEQRRQGWQIIDAETRLSTDDDPWQLAGMTISGRIDRIERHEQHGVRLTDFKTRKRETVEERHITALKRAERPEGFAEWMLVTGSDGAAARWTDLQLPLYRLSMERRFPGEKITTAHVSLSKTQPETGLEEWSALDDALLDSARRCAEGVIKAIRGRQFWPPAEELPYGDDFGALFFGEPLDAVDASLLTGKEAA